MQRQYSIIIIYYYVELGANRTNGFVSTTWQKYGFSLQIILIYLFLTGGVFFKVVPFSETRKMSNGTSLYDKINFSFEVPRVWEAIIVGWHRTLKFNFNTSTNKMDFLFRISLYES